MSTGETLKIFAAGNESEIKSMMHGQAGCVRDRGLLDEEFEVKKAELLGRL